MDNKIITILAMAMLVLSSVGVASMCLDTAAAADTSFTVTDYNGKTFSFDGPVEHIVVFGYAATLTITEAGGINKIIACDKYSVYDYYKDERLKNLNAYDLGSPYGTDFSGMRTWLLKAVENGDFDKENDAIIITGSSALNTNLRPQLESDGFKRILFWGTLNDYDDMITCVDSIAKIAAGVDNPVSSEAKQIYEDVLDEVSKREKRVDFVYLWYSASNGIGVGDNTTLGSSLIIAAGGNNVAPSETTTSGGFYYGGTSYLLSILEDNPNAVIFLANNFNKNAAEFSAEYLGGSTSYNILVMEGNWNNYCLDSVKGLQNVSKYIAEVSGQEPNQDGDGNNNTMYYVLAAVIVIIVLGVAAYAIVSRKKRKQ